MVAPTSPALAWWTPTPETLIRLWPNYKAKAALTTIGTVTQWKPFTKWLVYFFLPAFNLFIFNSIYFLSVNKPIGYITKLYGQFCNKVII